ncbi:restriction endonuclease subunit S [Xanthomarina sp. GH4-25]|uniref:restriction endonuclease subunit S n=1 Tax=Xanthomarina sp. GH4-25 TaxID=3349335 RepID=UPI0038780B4F
MPNNWKTYKLGEIIDYQKGYAFKSKWYQDSGKLIVRVSDTTSDSVDISTCHRISEENAKNLMQYELLENDIIIASVGSWPPNYNSVVGKVVKVPKSAQESLLNQNAVRLRTKDKKKFNQRFIYDVMKTHNFLNYIVNRAQGSASQASIKLTDIFGYEFSLPPLQEQTQIANILSAIDDKIENNLATNKTLEDMAMALYKHWFVDFGPFQDGEFVDSELGLIPKGWEEKRLDDLAQILNSKRVPLSTGQRSNRKGKYPYYGASGVIDNIDDFIFDGEYVIISEDGENLRSRKTPIGFSAIGKFWVNNHAHILEGKQNGINKLIICHIAQMDMNPYLTGAVQPKLNKSNLLSIGIAMPKEDSIIQEVLDEFYSISRLIFSNEKENQSLTKLRDTLLPKLINGEVRLKEFREQLENVIVRNEAIS